MPLLEEEKKNQVEQAVKAHLEKKEYELVSFKIGRHSGGFLVELLVDKTCGGISIDECAEINRQLGELLEENNYFEKRYYLVVASPGLDWPLKTKSDFFRNRDHKVRISLHPCDSMKNEFVGVIKEVFDKSVIVTDEKQQEKEILFKQINRAQQII